MNRIALALILFATACTAEGPIEVRADGPVGWDAELELAVAEWNDALVARGCAPPLELAASGLPLRWTEHRSEDDFALVYRPEEILVLDRTKLPGSYHSVLLHALGTLIGLETLPAGADSVMGGNLCRLPEHLTDYDVDRAAFVLGCP